MNVLFLQFLLGVIFLTIISLHIIKKNIGTVIAYGIQSFVVVLILLNSFFETNNTVLLFVILLTFIVKVILAPVFFIRLIKRHELTFSASTNLNMPLTLIILAGLTAIAHSDQLSPLGNIIPTHHALLLLALSSIFISLFLIVNRKGAFSQAIGILSLENSIVSFAIFAGLEQSLILQVGIISDILIWIMIASVFIAMIYRHFGSLDTSLMKHLKD